MFAGIQELSLTGANMWTLESSPQERPSVTLEDIEGIKIEQSFAKKQSESCKNRQQVTITK